MRAGKKRAILNLRSQEEGGVRMKILVLSDSHGNIENMMRAVEQEQPENIFNRPWIASLLEHGKLTELDRTTMAETVKEILVFEDGHIEITYLFSDEMGVLNEPEQDC